MRIPKTWATCLELSLCGAIERQAPRQLDPIIHHNMFPTKRPYYVTLFAVEFGESAT